MRQKLLVLGDCESSAFSALSDCEGCEAMENGGVGKVISCVITLREGGDEGSRARSAAADEASEPGLLSFDCESEYGSVVAVDIVERGREREIIEGEGEKPKSDHEVLFSEKERVSDVLRKTLVRRGNEMRRSAIVLLPLYLFVRLTP